MPERVVFCWSGGKDSALALHEVRSDGRYDVVALVTTCNRDFRRVSMHGVRIELAEAQARAIGLPLDVLYLAPAPTNAEYLDKFTAYLRARKSEGVTGVVFGDIFLEDLKQWREEHLAGLGMRGIFPLWKRDTKALVEQFLALGFGSIVCCADAARLDQRAVGRVIDRTFLDGLPANVDPCGENGEFHSFAFAGPIFREAIPFSVGEAVRRDGFWYCDLLPADSLPNGA